MRGLPPGRERAEAALHCFLARVFEDSTDFVFHEQRFDSAFRELEGVVGDGRSESLCVAVLLGIELQSDELGLGEGLSIARGDAFAEAPDEARWDGIDGRPNTLVVLRWEPLAGDPAPMGEVRARLSRMLTGLRLYDAVKVAFAPLGWTRTAGAPWQPLALGPSPAPRRSSRSAPSRRMSCAPSSASSRAGLRRRARSHGRCVASTHRSNAPIRPGR